MERYDDFDAWLAEGADPAAPVYEFTLQGHRYVVPGIDVEAFARYATLQEGLSAMDIPEMIRTLKTMVADQLLEADRDLWMQARVPYQALTKICERLAEAAVGRPTQGLSSSGGASVPIGQPLSPVSSVPGTLPPPSAG
jgi:hypothetical protein